MRVSKDCLLTERRLIRSPQEMWAAGWLKGDMASYYIRVEFMAVTARFWVDNEGDWDYIWPELKDYFGLPYAEVVQLTEAEAKNWKWPRKC